MVGSVSRRGFLGSAAAASVVGTVAVAPGRAWADPVPPDRVRLSVNGKTYEVDADPTVTLLDALRERLGLTGTKKGCDRGQCGACTVHVDGRRVVSCLTLAIACADKKVVTIEGVADGEALHPVQQAFVDCDGFQCGFCTSGQIMSAVEVVEQGTARSDEEIREAMSGNICRCGAYPNIVDAIKQCGIDQNRGAHS
jgi:xanthine dehydrogenase YagT iron-sulfur-binding subunit